jgi:alpha-beta hydrolase superfamily lysophospholipase
MLLLAAGIVIAVMAFEDKLIYFPEKYPNGFWGVEHIPSRSGSIVPKIEDCFFETSDGLKLHGWFCTPYKKTDAELTPIPADMALLWFHGNAGNITYRYDMIREMMELPVVVFIIDYRGYGHSSGGPPRAKLVCEDGERAWNYLVAERNIPPAHIAIYGHSMGGAVAIDLASKHPDAGALITEGTLTSIIDRAHGTWAAYLPLRLILTERFDSLSKIGSIRVPKLILHGDSDTMVPPIMARQLYDAAPEPKQIALIPAGGHNDSAVANAAAYFGALNAFLAQYGLKPGGNAARKCSIFSAGLHRVQHPPRPTSLGAAIFPPHENREQEHHDQVRSNQ